MNSPSMWARASQLAAETPESRNRYVDLLRALSITVVVLGHWIMAAPHLSASGAELAHLLDVVPWFRWLTWLFQVMPIFFFVGGYSNGTSWDHAHQRGQAYGEWLEARMRRLMGPVVPLIVLWIGLGAVGFWLGVPEGMIRVGSRVALVPVWFLAIYLLIVMLVPFTRWAWHRLGIASVLVPALLAMLNDIIFLNTDHTWLGWLNYLFVWSAVHQLGYAWQERGLGSSGRLLLLFALGLAALWMLTQLGPYPTSLVGVPSEELSNTTPPKLPVLALGLAQIGLLLPMEKAARRVLARQKPWAATVLVNGMIMTIFLWHSTAMVLTIGVGFALAPAVFDLAPGTAVWWWLRPLWVAVFALATFPFLMVFNRVEQRIARGRGHPVPLWRLLIGASLLCAGLALLAATGVGGPHFLGLDWPAILLVLVGSSLAGFGPLESLRSAPSAS